MDLEKQIIVNVKLERMINELKFEEIKLNKKIKAYQYKIKSYTDKMKAIEKYKNDEKLKQRMNIFILTCKNMIKKLEEDIKEMQEELDYKRKYVSDSCQEILIDAIREETINEETILNKNGCLIYMLPSARISFKPQEIIIQNEKVLKKFLLENKLNTYIDGEKIYLSLLKKDVFIAEDGSIINSDGLIFDGLSLSELDMKMEVF